MISLASTLHSIRYSPLASITSDRIHSRRGWCDLAMTIVRIWITRIHSDVSKSLIVSSSLSSLLQNPRNFTNFRGLEVIQRISLDHYVTSSSRHNHKTKSMVHSKQKVEPARGRNRAQKSVPRADVLPESGWNGNEGLFLASSSHSHTNAHHRIWISWSLSTWWIQACFG